MDNKKKKEPKPLPADYIKKAEGPKEVADEDKVEETAGGNMDTDFLGGFDAFDEDDDAPKEEVKKDLTKGKSTEHDHSHKR